MHEPLAFCSLAIVIGTCLFSWRGFRSKEFEERFIFCPEYILAYKEFHRIITSGFLHADGRHLLFNMISLYLFGELIEFVHGPARLLTIYFGSLIGGSLLSLLVHRNHDYRAYGASGGVSGLIFAYIFLFPGGTISAFFIPIGIPAWLYAVLFMAASFYGMKNRVDNVGHDAHLGGAIIGFGITAVLWPEISSESPILFWTTLAASLLMILYVLYNPMFLPLNSFLQFPARKLGRKRGSAKRLDIDAILEKINAKGIDSLTVEEHALLKNTSQKYQRRAESKKPESELLF